MALATSARLPVLVGKSFRMIATVFARLMNQTRITLFVDHLPIINAILIFILNQHSSGRGGLGNIILSKSRSRSRGPGNVLVHGTGRGGVDNIKPGEPVDVEIRQVEDAERAAYPVSPGVYVPSCFRNSSCRHSTSRHSTGRGGVANLTDTTAPPIERVPPGPGHPHASHAHEFESTGRGGAGNIRSRSVSQGADGRSPSKDRAEKHGISALFQRVARSGSRPPKDDREVSSVAEEYDVQS